MLKERREKMMMLREMKLRWKLQLGVANEKFAIRDTSRSSTTSKKRLKSCAEAGIRNALKRVSE